MVGVDMRFERVFERETEFAHQVQVALDRFQHRIDQRGFARFVTGDEIGVGRRLRLKQLAENHSVAGSNEGEATTWPTHSPKPIRTSPSHQALSVTSSPSSRKLRVSPD